MNKNRWKTVYMTSNNQINNHLIWRTPLRLYQHLKISMLPLGSHGRKMKKQNIIKILASSEEDVSHLF